MPLSKDGMGWWLFSPCALPMTEGTQAVGDIELYYRMGGSGPPLLLLHGMTRTGREWDPWLDELGERYTVIVPDLPGHGRSTRPPGGFLFREVARALFAFLDQLGVGRIRAIGHDQVG